MPRKTRRPAKPSETPARSSRPQAVCFTDYLDSLDKEHVQSVLHRLWNHWESIRRDAGIDFGEPLGHQKKTLIMGCMDSIEMQELRMHEQKILQTVNAFLGSAVFTKLRVDLLLGKQSITQSLAVRAKKTAEPSAPEHQAVGTFLDKMDPHSAIARCYRTYLREKTSFHS
ncbi:MAG: DUF721 domain-containing protein [Desulfovibrio sp.]|nr:DUF721 domain-containing protein [Desulfovibrio sp.]